MQRLRKLLNLSAESSASENTDSKNLLPLLEQLPTSVFIPTDNPIKDESSDSLNRLEPAQRFARNVISLDVSEGAVVGIMGAWGSGKTSFINLARTEFKTMDVPVLDFNPWMFSGAEQLVGTFFTEISAQLSIKPGWTDVAKDIAEYGEAFAVFNWIPFIGPLMQLFHGVTKVVSTHSQAKQGGVAKKREQLRQVLSKIPRPLVIVIDDIDRLTTAEIRDIFKLVRLTASFPNIIYVVAFDRLRVEKALEEQKVSGRDYLEKILQVAINLPVIPSDIILSQITESINTAIADVETQTQLNQERWANILLEIISPLIRNMRDVRRYSTAVRWAAKTLDGRITIEDILALESIRIFLPNIYEKLYENVDSLTKPASNFVGGAREPDTIRESIAALVKDAENIKVTRAMIFYLFPAAARHIGGDPYGYDWQPSWLRERRVAHKDLLKFYFERTVGHELASFADAEAAFKLMEDEREFESYLRSIDPNRVEDVIASIANFEEDFTKSHVVPGSTVLLNLISFLPKKVRGFFDLSPDLIINRIVYRLLKSLGDQKTIALAVREILPSLTTISSRFNLINLVGYRENVGQKMVSEEDARQLENSWQIEVKNLPHLNLEQEYDLLRVLHRAKSEPVDDTETFEIPNNPRVTLALLKSAQSEIKSISSSSRFTQRESVLAWDALVDLFGSSKQLQTQITQLRASDLEIGKNLSDLIDKYLSGWRPKDLGSSND